MIRTMKERKQGELVVTVSPLALSDWVARELLSPSGGGGGVISNEKEPALKRRGKSR